MTDSRLDFCEKISVSVFGDGSDLLLSAEISTGEKALDNAVVTLSAVPAFIRPAEARFEHLAPFTHTDVRPSLRILPDLDVIASVSAATEAVVTLTVRDGSGTAVSSASVRTEILPYSFWPAEYAPESVAAFVMPGYEHLAQVRKMMSEALGHWGRKADLDGYLGDVNRVQDLGAAAFSALRRFGIAYSNPPEGFELHGHRVRLPGEVLGKREGNCLDLSLLYCSALESVGLNTVVFVSKGLVYAGFWLVDDHLQDMICTDPARFTRQIRNGDMRAVDCTMLAAGAQGDFSAAAESALSKLDDQNSFMYAVDIAAARIKVPPLPVRTAGGWSVSYSGGPSGAPEEVERAAPLPGSGSPTSRTEMWKRELLDTTTRNYLISMKAGSRVLPLLVTDGPGLEDAFQDDRQFTVRPRPDGWNGADTYPKKPFEAELYMGNYSNVSADELSRGWLRTPFTDAETEKAVRMIYRSARKEMEESGYNALFIGIGQLRWFEPHSSRPRYAPLVLIPAELVKKDAGYVLRKYDEETVFNITLSEFLRQEYGVNLSGLDDIPQDEHGMDVDYVMQAVRRAVSAMEGWDVINGACLGVFTFAQYAMWKDLGTNMELLRRNPVVCCMADGTVLQDPQELDYGASPYSLCLTVPADGSQIKAVRAAGEGRSFVMHGPPGTGKSQTITNIISDSLYRGKTVLFVAEKRAALEVVESRLKKIGIGNHCLELHSNKTEKSQVLAQLKSSLEACKPVDTGKLEDLMRSIERERSRLDAYVEALHDPGSSGISVYDCIVRSEAYSSRNLPDLRVPEGFAAALPPGGADDLADRASQAARAYLQVSDMDNEVMRGIRTTDAVLGIDDDISAACEKASQAFQRFTDQAHNMSASGITVDMDDPSRSVAAIEAVLSVPASSARDGDLLGTADGVGQLYSAVQDIGMAVRDFGDMFSFADPNRMDAFAENVRSIQTKLESRGFRCGSAGLYEAATEAASRRRELTPDLRDIRAVWKESVFESPLAPTISARYAEAASAGLLARKKARQAFMNEVLPLLRVPSTSFEQLQQSAPKITPFCESCGALQQLTAKIETICAKLLEELRGQSDALRGAASQLTAVGISPSEFPNIRARIDLSPDSALNFTKASKEFSEACAALDTLLVTERPTDTKGFRTLRDALDRYRGRLFDWASWNICRLWFEDRGMGSFTDAVRAGRSPDDMYDGTFAAVYRQVFSVGRQRSEALRLFSSDGFEKDVEKFRKLDEQYTLLNRQILKYKLFLNTPQSLDGSVAGTEAALLYRAINSTRMRKSIRQLLQEIPNLLPKVCPCLLMSPQSVAQYITADFPQFDIVIFDESSQIVTSKAIGALGRGKACVVAGDNKQLPPTSFFQKRIEDADDEDAIDVESFLDDCLSVRMPETYLEWHYRSRHESLIGFSNRMFYGNRMLTFPSPNDSVAKVSFVKVGGTYSRSTRSNPAEADAIAKEVHRRVMDPVLSKYSVGIIAFSVSQQSEIEDRIEDMEKSDPAFSKALAAAPEPMFIKNLETVQGDERDVILFSVGYGPDSKGNVLQNFGPVNRAGGGRRLNVAFSRARAAMVIFSSMTYSDVKITPTSSMGVKALREFLRYAQNGGRFQTDTEEDRSYVSAVFVDAAAALEKRGYRCRFGIGKSDFRVDIAVVDPDDPQRYVLGILGDGDSYRASENTRDREYARADILRNLGWNIAHLWSVEWYFRRERVIENLVNAIEKARAGITEAAPEPVHDQQVLETFGADLPPVRRTRRAEYIPVSASDVPVFGDPLSTAGVQAICGTIIAAESPISEEHLIWTFQQVTGIKRLSPKQKEGLIDNLRRLFIPVERSGFITYWRSGSDPTVLPEYRVPSDPSKARDIDSIPLPELLSAISEAADSYGSFDRASAPKIIANMFGFSRPGERIKTVTDQVLDIAVQTGILKEDCGRFVKA